MLTLQRIVNGMRKVAAGLRPFNESVWPGVTNDLFVAHQSIYVFTAAYCVGKRVLDAGCGTGYGSAHLAKGAQAVIGVDLDRRSIAYARRHFSAGNLQYEIGDLQHLGFTADIDVVVASNSLEHLDRPEAFFAGARRALREGGIMIVAVPPIYTTHDVEAHQDIHYHRSNLTIREWHDLLAAEGFEVSCFRHVARPGISPDFASPRSSRLVPADFSFAGGSLEDLANRLSITAVFVARASERSRLAG